jgi:hypothetical protein
VPFGITKRLNMLLDLWLVLVDHDHEHGGEIKTGLKRTSLASTNESDNLTPKD